MNITTYQFGEWKQKMMGFRSRTGYLGQVVQRQVEEKPICWLYMRWTTRKRNSKNINFSNKHDIIYAAHFMEAGRVEQTSKTGEALAPLSTLC